MAIVIKETASFSKSYENIADRKAAARILARITRIKTSGEVCGSEFKNFGDCKVVHGTILMLKINVGKGHRVYLVRTSDQEFTAVHCGIKDTQDADIQLVKKTITELF
ncbi:hypothetical protein U2E25_17500 [Acinetobacter baumannii]|uniref:hypothetical protein n=1 Tax=Acinetobacter baumannii TaxID=470 RepID=UPI00338D381C